MRRETLARDCRQRRISLTPAAVPLLAEVRASIAGLRRDILEDFSDAEIASALTVLLRLKEKTSKSALHRRG